MINYSKSLDLTSDYSCANANSDVPHLMKQLQQLQAQQDGSPELEEQLNHVKNQLHFIKTKCGLR
ncbi:DUF2524 domain-containing protein [Paenibacillus marinisediminis]